MTFKLNDRVEIKPLSNTPATVTSIQESSANVRTDSGYFVSGVQFSDLRKVNDSTDLLTDHAPAILRAIADAAEEVAKYMRVIERATDSRYQQEAAWRRFAEKLREKA